MSSRKKDIDKLVQDRIRLARLEEGGSPARPIDLQSASQVEPRVLSYRCIKCEGEPRIAEHRAEELEEGTMRVVIAQCRRCSGKRTFYVRIVARTLN